MLVVKKGKSQVRLGTLGVRTRRLSSFTMSLGSWWRLGRLSENRPNGPKWLNWGRGWQNSGDGFDSEWSSGLVTGLIVIV